MPNEAPAWRQAQEAGVRVVSLAIMSYILFLCFQAGVSLKVFTFDARRFHRSRIEMQCVNLDIMLILL
jgi:hypothetical protein